MKHPLKMDPSLLEPGMPEAQEDIARLRQIIAELLVTNQKLRWALQDSPANRGVTKVSGN